MCLLIRSISSLNSIENIKQRATRLLDQEGSDNDWKIIAQIDNWGHKETTDWTEEDMFSTREKLLRIIPKHLSSESQMIENQMLEYILLNTEKANHDFNAITLIFKKDIKQIVENLIRNPEVSWKSFIFNGTRVLKWAKEFLPKDEQRSLYNDWNEALKKFAKDTKKLKEDGTYALLSILRMYQEPFPAKAIQKI